MAARYCARCGARLERKNIDGQEIMVCQSGDCQHEVADWSWEDPGELSVDDFAFDGSKKFLKMLQER